MQSALTEREGDPGLAPASKWSFISFIDHLNHPFAAGTPEAGGWTTRELKRIIRGLAGLNFVFAPFTTMMVVLTG